MPHPVCHVKNSGIEDKPLFPHKINFKIVYGKRFKKKTEILNKLLNRDWSAGKAE